MYARSAQYGTVSPCSCFMCPVYAVAICKVVRGHLGDVLGVVVVLDFDDADAEKTGSGS